MTLHNQKFNYSMICEATSNMLSHHKYSAFFKHLPQFYIPRNTQAYLLPFLSLISPNKYYLKSILAGFLRLFISIINPAYRDFLNYVRLREEVDILIFSHLFSEDQNLDADIYFGNLLSICKSTNMRVKFVLFNHNNIKHDRISSRIKRDAIVLPSFGSFSNELRCLGTGLARLPILLMASIKWPIAIESRLMRRASFLALSNAGLDLSVKRLLFQALFKATTPKMIFLSREGLGWEKVCISALHKQVPNGKAIGYQHIPIFKSAWSMVIDNDEMSRPDVLMFSSRLYAEIFDKLNAKRTTFNKKVVYGNHRKIKIDHAEGSSLGQVPNSIILLPQGFDWEVRLFMSLAEDLSTRFPNFQIYMTVHPSGKRPKLLTESGAAGRTSRLEFRTTDEILNISGSSFVLFSGSSAYIPFCCNGALPIVYSVKDRVDFDISPIFTLTPNIPVANSSRELIDIIQSYDKCFSVSELKSLREKLAKIYDPIDIAVIADLIKHNDSEQKCKL
jgi:hypothetical protein